MKDKVFFEGLFCEQMRADLADAHSADGNCGPPPNRCPATMN
jgi:hypothetical protein